jgi:hypothetical protein
MTSGIVVSRLFTRPFKGSIESVGFIIFPLIEVRFIPPTVQPTFQPAINTKNVPMRQILNEARGKFHQGMR